MEEGNSLKPYGELVKVEPPEWKAPDLDELTDVFTLQTSLLMFKVKVKADIADISAANFKLYRNDTLAVPEQDYEPGSISFGSGFPSNGLPTHIYAANVYLVEGENELVVRFEHNGEVHSTPPIYVTYTPPRTNLHVFSFGVPQDDLDFTATDAELFAREFDTQRNLLFKEVNLNVFTTRDTTTAHAMSITIDKIVESHQYGRIEENDAVVFFLSSHGLTPETDTSAFLIAGSDADFRYTRTLLDFDTEVLQKLAKLKTNTYVFVDACHSGVAANMDAGSKGETEIVDASLSKAITRLAESTPGVNMMLSCGPGEVSWEDESWGSGAFTKALVEAFDNRRYNRSKKKVRADVDNNGILTMNEIFEYVSVRVPEIVKTKETASKVTQTPYMTEAAKERDLPVYKIHN